MENYIVKAKFIHNNGHESSIVRFFYYKRYAEYCAKEMHNLGLLDISVKYHHIKINGKIVFDTRSWWDKFKNSLKMA